MPVFQPLKQLVNINEVGSRQDIGCRNILHNIICSDEAVGNQNVTE